MVKSGDFGGTSLSRRKRCRALMHGRDVFHAYMVRGARFEGEFDMPVLSAVPLSGAPRGLIPFSEAMRPGCRDYDCHVHFYEDDYRFERFWNSPWRYVRRLARFPGIITPDFSTNTDFPGALKVYNTFRDRACGYYLSRCGFRVIPNVRCESLTEGWQLDGLPHGSLIAVGARACVADPGDRRLLVEGVRLACDALHPAGIVWYGSTRYGVTDYPASLGIPVLVFPGAGRGLLGGGAHE